MGNDSRIRLLRILELLQHQTDEIHPLTTVDLERLLNEKYDIQAYRITIQKDIAALIAAGYEIEVLRSTQNRYYIANRLFELPELKLLVDAIASSKFITQKKGSALIEKITMLASVHQAESLKRNLLISRAGNPGNDRIYYIADVINEAIIRKKKISFLYFNYNEEKKKELRNNGSPYVFSPYTLVWNGDCYYVVGYCEKHHGMTTFRVDRIYQTPELLKEDAVPLPSDVDLEAYVSAMPRMYDGPHERVKLQCKNEMMNAVIDHFGESVETQIADETSFFATVDVAITPVFLRWVFGFGGKIVILSPESVRRSYLDLLNAGMKTIQVSEREE